MDPDPGGPKNIRIRIRIRIRNTAEPETLLIKVCEVRARETETVAVQLAKNQYGHKVIINMIEVHSVIHIKGFLPRELFIQKGIPGRYLIKNITFAPFITITEYRINVVSRVRVSLGFR